MKIIHTNQNQCIFKLSKEQNRRNGTCMSKLWEQQSDGWETEPNSCVFYYLKSTFKTLILDQKKETYNTINIESSWLLNWINIGKSDPHAFL